MKLAATLLLAAVAAGATTITFKDPYQGAFPGDAFGDGSDVKGLLRSFDIESIRFTHNGGPTVQLTIRMNYNSGDAALKSFGAGSEFGNLNAGDVLFSIGNAVRYGVPLQSHGGLTAGNLYRVSGGLTAYDVLHASCSGCYNPNEPVWMDPSGAAGAGSGSVLVSRIFPEGAEVEVNIAFVADQPFLDALAGGMNLHFAAATCGNDVVNGSVQSQVPEPGTLALVGLTLLGAGVVRKRSKS